MSDQGKVIGTVGFSFFGNVHVIYKACSRDMDTREHNRLHREKIAPFRDSAKENLQEIVQRLIVSGEIPEKLKLDPNFTPGK